jgi:calcium-dependent protein kinase
MAVLSPDLNFFDVNHLFDIIDIDNDGTISYTEFVAATLDPRGIDIEQLNEAFKLMDAGGKGFITFEDIQRVSTISTLDLRAKYD